MNGRRLARLCRSAGLVVSLAAGLDGCATAMQRPPSLADSIFAQVRLDAAVQEHWRFLPVSRPDLAARAGVAVTRLPDPTQAQAKRDAQFARAGLVALDEIPVRALTEDAYVTWLSLRWEFEAMTGWTAFHWTQLTDLAPGQSIFDRSIAILKAQRIQDPAEAQQFLSLVASVSDVARVLRIEYEERARRDIRLSRAAAIRAIAHVRGLIAPAESSPFGLPPDYQPSLNDPWQSELVRAVDSVIEQRVNPSLVELATLLERNLDAAPESPGLSRLPGGAEHYATLLRYRTTLDVSPADAHVIGLGEVTRIAALTAAARRDAGLPVNRDSLRAVLARDSTFVVDDEQSIPEAAARLFEAATTSLDTLFQPAPATPLTIGVMSSELDSASLARYEAATVAQPSARYLLSIPQLKARSALVLPGLILGDLMPGLHRQQGTQLENEELPAFRRLAFHDGFVRGWQVYALDVADSLSGALAPWQRFGVRLRELAAACGLVVDTGINALGWTRADALTFLHTWLPDDDADLEREFILVAIESPGTLSAATLGARELRGLRRWAMRELGDRFSMAAFHREVLRTGSVPLPVLGEHLERWIWEQNNPPAPPIDGARRR
jgi:uncharacterized protein (DUF885 family)